MRHRTPLWLLHYLTVKVNTDKYCAHSEAATVVVFHLHRQRGVAHVHRSRSGIHANESRHAERGWQKRPPSCLPRLEEHVRSLGSPSEEVFKQACRRTASAPHCSAFPFSGAGHAPVLFQSLFPAFHVQWRPS